MCDVAAQRQALYVALKDARDGLAEMIGYVPEYFVYKWDLESYLNRANKALEEADDE